MTLSQGTLRVMSERHLDLLNHHLGSGTDTRPHSTQSQDQAAHNGFDFR
jgi:hypothetical protein